MSFITQKGATGPLSLQANGTFQSSTDANLATLVGTRWDLSDGREVILVSTSATSNATQGFLYQDAALVANHQNLATVSFTAYSNNGNIPASVVVTLGATAATANQYQGGLAIVNAGAGLGQTLRIASNTAAIASGTIAVVFEDGPNTALTTASKICLTQQHGANIVTFPTTPTNGAVGVGLYVIAPSSYGFLTSKGITSAISDALIAAVGAQIAASVTTAGTVTVSSGTNATIVGTALIAGVSAEARPVTIDL
jgi:hypothetical protein